METLNLAGKRLFKISHGSFYRETRYKHSGILKVLEKNNWISMDINTVHGQGDSFHNKLEIGDYVYVCYSNDKLYCLGRVLSQAKEFEGVIQEEIIKGAKAGEVWMYREIELLFLPQIASLDDIKNENFYFMPRGLSTFWEVPRTSFDYINGKIFMPKFNVKIIYDMEASIPLKNQGEVLENKMDSKNIILYGPPGTGKTFRTIAEALKILGENISEDNRALQKLKFSEYQKANRVFFTTFHQNMAYEDFMEGIKPLEPEEEDEFLKYEIQDGLFMRACVEASFNYIQSNFQKEQAVKKLIDFNDLFDKLYERISNSGSEILKTKSGGEVTATVTSQGNFAILHKEREKNYTVSRDRLSRIFELYPSPDEITNATNAFRSTIGGCNSTAYWSVLKAIAEIRDEGEIKDDAEDKITEELTYGDKRKIVQKYWNKKDYAVLAYDHSDPFVLIIDEINRGNVAQIFGELITLIEDDKRMGKMEAIYAELPYSKKSFAAPSNLYIIGTMNTADRSVEALDTALRRRFSFIPILPEPEKLKVTDDAIDLPKMLRSLNERLTILKDHDHTIGHAWFWNVTNLEQLKSVYGNRILPLLQEFFYNDYEKLGLVLGDVFFEPPKKVNHKIFAKFKGGNDLSDQYDDTWQYQLKSADKLTIADFQSLYQTNIPPATDE